MRRDRGSARPAVASRHRGMDENEPVIRRRGLWALLLAGALAAVAVALWSAPQASAAPASAAEVALRAHVLAGRAAEGAAGLLRYRPALQAHGHRPADGERRGRAARPVGPDQHREGRPDGGRPRARAVRLPPGLPRRRAPARLHLRAVGGAARGDRRSADGLRPGGHRGRRSRASSRSSTGSSTSTTTGTTSTRATGR